MSIWNTQKTVSVQPKSVVIQSKLTSALNMFDVAVKNLQQVINDSESTIQDNNEKIAVLITENDKINSVATKSNKIILNINALLGE